MGKLVLRIVINAVALWVAAYVVPGIGVTSDVAGLLVAAVVVCFVKYEIKPGHSIFYCDINQRTQGFF